jgi:hypothetical protein
MKLKHITEICRKIYERKGLSSVIDHVDFQMQMGNQAYKDVKDQYCTPCDTVTPHWKNECLGCGSDNVR